MAVRWRKRRLIWLRNMIAMDVRCLHLQLSGRLESRMWVAVVKQDVIMVDVAMESAIVHDS